MFILVNTPLLSIPAGVSSHYKGLRHFFSDRVVYNQFVTSGYLKRIFKNRVLYKFAQLLCSSYNLVKFFYLIFRYRKPLVLLNPSFGERALKRDLLYLKISKKLGCKVAVFMHGWDKVYLSKVLNGEIFFSPIWKKADAFFVLAREFESYIKDLGIECPVYITTTKVDEFLIEGIPVLKNINKIRNILFLARVEKEKGIYTAIDAFDFLLKNHPYLALRVVGGGECLKQSIDYVKKNNIKNVVFTGPLFGDDLKKEFLNADVYILPTFSEGLPTTVLEAMAFGLPVISRPVGGLNDFFENDKMGYLVNSHNPADFAHQISRLISDTKKANEISNYNSKYAREMFLASSVAKKLENELFDI